MPGTLDTQPCSCPKSGLYQQPACVLCLLSANLPKLFNSAVSAVPNYSLTIGLCALSSETWLVRWSLRCTAWVVNALEVEERAAHCCTEVRRGTNSSKVSVAAWDAIWEISSCGLRPLSKWKTYFGDEQNGLKSNKGLKIELNDFLKVLENTKSWIKQNFRHFYSQLYFWLLKLSWITYIP